MLEILNRNKKYIIITISLVLILAMFTSTVIKVRTKTKNAIREGYRLESVDGAEFAVDTKLSEYATAVSEISKNIEFLDYQTYSYKDGENIYLLFNINSFIVVVKRGTDFNFAENEVDAALKENSLNGIWFSTHGRDPIKVSTAERMEIDVEAQVVITNSVYNDFYGTLTVMRKDNEEWSMFIGTTEVADDKYKESLNYMKTTFALCETPEIDHDSYMVDENGLLAKAEEIDVPQDTEMAKNETSAEITPDTPVVNPPEPEEIPEEIPVENPVVEEPSENIPIETEVVETTPEIPVEEPTEIEITEEPPIKPTVIEEPQPEPEPSKEPVPEEPVKNEKEKEGLEIEKVNGEIPLGSAFTVKSNQKNIDYKKDSIYTSSVYGMLSVGYTGYMSIFNEFGKGGMQNSYIRIDQLYSAEETKELIAEYIASGDSYYTSIEAPQGTHYEAVRYSVNYLNNEESYVNIQLCGLDGENLKHRGVSYTQNTYDIHNKVTIENDWNTGYICFYAVPNGCKEYALKCGDGSSETKTYAAYYKIEVE